jgi:hypothetical protein
MLALLGAVVITSAMPAFFVPVYTALLLEPHRLCSYGAVLLAAYLLRVPDSCGLLHSVAGKRQTFAELRDTHFTYCDTTWIFTVQ